MNLNEYRNKDARNLAKLIGIAFEAGKITQEAFDAGSDVSLDMEAAHRQKGDMSPAIAAAAAERREKFNALFEMDTSLPKNGEAG